MAGLKEAGKWLLRRCEDTWNGLDRGIGRIWQICTKDFWTQLEEGDSNAKDGTSLVLALATFAVTQGGVLGFVANYTDQKYFVLGFFAFLAILTIIAILIVLKLQDPSSSVRAPRRYYDRGTITFGYWTLILATVLPSVLLFLVWLDILSPPMARQPFPPGQIQCDALTPNARLNGTKYVSLTDRRGSSNEAVEGDRVLGRWLSLGADASLRLNPQVVLSAVEGYMEQLADASTEELQSVSKNVRSKFERKYGDKIKRPTHDGLYVVRQKIPFQADFQEFVCHVEVSGATVREITDRLVFLASENEVGRITLRQFYFDWDTKRGMTNKFRVKPNMGERILVLLYLEKVTETPTATIVASR